MPSLKLAIAAALGFSVFGAVRAQAAKSNQIRPTPSPIETVGLAADTWVFAPRLVYTSYSDVVQVPGYAGQSWEYGIRSLGVAVEGQRGINDWLAVEVSLEGYQKLGEISGPSPTSGLPTVANVRGNAFKLGLQADVKLFTHGGGASPRSGDFTLYFFARGIGDVFHQTQEDPTFETEFDERSFEYRSGLAAHIHVYGGAHLALFGGIDGLFFTGQQVDALQDAAPTTTDIGGSEGPYPYFGGDVLWAPASLGGDVLSLSGVLALTTESEDGFGGRVFTMSVGYAWRFDGRS